MSNITTFGENTWDTTPQRTSLYGSSGWWTLPTEWYCWTDENRQVWCSPNASREPRYACKMDYDFTLKFFDMYRNRQAGIA